MARPLNKLSASEVKAAQATDRSWKLFDGGGLFLHVTPKGRYWRLKYRWGGRERLLALGVYPDVTLKRAREKRDDARELLDDGIDPSARRKAEKAARRNASAATLETVAREWYEGKHRREVVATHAGRNLRRLEVHVFPRLGSRPIAEVEPPEVLEALRRIERLGHVETAHRVKTLVSQVIRYAVATGRARRDVTADLCDALKTARPKHHAAIVDPGELGTLLRVIDAYGGQPATRGALQLAPLVAVRPGELRRARWADIDLDAARWEVTAKGGTSLVVPLSRQAVDVLRDMEPVSGRSEWVFPSNRGQDRPMSDATINAALTRLDYGDKMKAHGWRAVFRTLAVERLQAPVEVVEMQLGHRVRDVHGQANNQTQWLEQRAELMQRWADYLDQLRAGGADGAG